MYKVECPICKRMHKMTNKNGELRHIIHCRCKDKFKYHTVIFYLSGVGYVIFDENCNLVDCYTTKFDDMDYNGSNKE